MCTSTTPVSSTHTTFSVKTLNARILPQAAVVVRLDGRLAVKVGVDGDRAKIWRRNTAAQGEVMAKLSSSLVARLMPASSSLLPPPGIFAAAGAAATAPEPATDAVAAPVAVCIVGEDEEDDEEDDDGDDNDAALKFFLTGLGMPPAPPRVVAMVAVQEPVSRDGCGVLKSCSGIWPKWAICSSVAMRRASSLIFSVLIPPA